MTIFIVTFLLTLGELVNANRKPNIIFIVADDLGWNDVGWRNPEVKTPNIDRLALNGVILNSSYVNPTCTPSRNSMLTGVYPFRVGLQHTSLFPRDTRHLSPEYETLPERLKELGYSTHMIGKWHLGFCNWKHTPTERGFDSFMGFFNGGEDYYKHTKESAYDFWLNKSLYYPPKGEYSTTTFTKRAVQLFKYHSKMKKKNPLFLYLSYQAVHTPLQVPKKYEKLYSHIGNRDRRTYYGMVTAMDQSIGTIITALRKYQLLRDSIIVFTTDNGGAAHIAGSNLPLRGSKTTLWEGGTRGVGFVYSSRLFKKGYVHNGLFNAVDWVPTLVAAAGGKQDKRIDGINQWPMLRAGRPSKRTEFVYSIGTSAAIRMGDYKLIVGHPGLYNRWFAVPKTRSFCASFNDESDNSENDDLFLYENLNTAVRNVRSYLSWVGTKMPGYSYWRQLKRAKSIEECKALERKERKNWVFPKYLLYNIKDDPTETTNIAGNKPMLIKKLNRRLEYYWKKAVIVPKQKDMHKNAAIVNGVWTPGWCQ